jgi:hypothetical protein
MTSVTVVTGGMMPLLPNPVEPDPLSVLTSSWVEVETTVLALMAPVLEAVAEAPLPGITLVLSEV